MMKSSEFETKYADSFITHILRDIKNKKKIQLNDDMNISTIVLICTFERSGRIKWMCTKLNLFDEKRGMLLMILTIT